MMEINTEAVLKGTGYNYSPCEVSLHTHSHYCGHGAGQVSDFVESAIAHGLKVLGFSEHCPLPNNRWRNTRMDYSQLPRYMADVELQQQRNDIIVVKGMECDYLPEYHEFYEQEMLGKWGCQYLIGSVHYINSDTRKDYSIHKGPLTSKDLMRYTDHYIDMLQSGLFLFGAHPDVFGCSYVEWDALTASCAKAIIEAAVSMNVPLEINANGIRRAKIKNSKGWVSPYPKQQFWELASEYDIVAITSSDAHYPKDIIAACDTCVSFAHQLSIPLANLCLSDDEYGMQKPSYVVA